MTSVDEAQASGEIDELAFDYIKAPDFRVVWADGIMGGPTPHDMIHCVLFSERPSIPTRQVFEVADTGGGQFKVGREIHEKRETRNSIVREMSCDVFMTPEVAKSVANWILQAVEQYEEKSKND